ncbi:Cocaine esterase [Gordonia sp. MP11Mi]|uniref:Cocaine esterase n=1 Tax=Gordonia sp. MP11Mi TaxID=3022769 RepID=A0AA97GUT1_9ACTN
MISAIEGLGRGGIHKEWLGRMIRWRVTETQVVGEAERGVSVAWVGVRALVCVALSAALVVTVFAPSVSAAPGSSSSKAWTRDYEASHEYAGVHVSTSVPVRMSDGVVLRADVYRPADRHNRPTTDKTPVIVNMTPYNKLISMIATTATNIPRLSKPVIDFLASINLSGTPISGTEKLLKMLRGGMVSALSMDPKLVRSGYTQVVLDVRGTGTSQGKWQVFGPRERKDTLEVLEWARTRSYSNGHLGMSGVSYSAVNQLQAAADGAKGLDAIFPVAPMTDIVSDVVAPGSGFGAGFLGLWLFAVNGSKMIPDLPRLLRGRFDPQWLRDRVTDPAVFAREYLQAIAAPTMRALSPEARQLVTYRSKYRESLTTDMPKVDVPTFSIGGWQDLFTNAEADMLNQLSSLTPDKKKLVMGTGQHLTNGWDMGGRGQPPTIGVLQKAWFDRWIKNGDNGIDEFPAMTSHLLGGGWRQSSEFPLPTSQYRRLYLTGKTSHTSPTSVRDGSLSASPPVNREQWTVRPGITTLCSGDTNRDLIGFVGFLDVCSKDNRIAERGALTFTSPRVSTSTRISGPVNVHLRTRVDARDGFYVAVASDVAPSGRSEVISTGSMSLSIRGQLDRSRSKYATGGDLVDPYYAFDGASRQPVKQGSSHTVDIGLLPTDALLKPGHRLRVSIYAFNAPRAISFGVISRDTGLRPEHVVIDPAHPSWVTVSSKEAIA